MPIYTLKVIIRIMLISALFFAACSNQSANNDKSEQSILVFKNVSVIDAADHLRVDQTVVITEHTITQVGLDAEISVPRGAVIVHGSGKYLIPGLWDAHVHLTYNSDIEPAMFALFLANGITSIRDTGGLLHKVKPWKEKSKQNPKSSPRVFIAGPLVDGLPNVYDGSQN